MAVVIYPASAFTNQNDEKIYRSIINSTVPNATTVTLPVTAAGDANIAVASSNLATALQTALRAIPNKAVINISQGIVLDGATFKGWASITYNP